MIIITNNMKIFEEILYKRINLCQVIAIKYYHVLLIFEIT